MTAGEIAVTLACSAVVGGFAGGLVQRSTDSAPPAPKPTTVELDGYGPDGEPGTFLYDCVFEDERYECAQREGDGRG